jgi:ABC-type dipeptide/oligopeptide/nickel transport system permease subunit
MTVQLGSCAAGVVLSESALGFVGLGPADGVSLGALLEQGTVAMLIDARVLAIAALAIIATSGSLQMASEGLRKRLLPQ